MEIIKDTQSDQLDLESIGIKGAALRHLRSLRFYVPKFTVLTSGFFETLAQESGFAQKAAFAVENITDRMELTREFARLIEGIELPESLKTSLAQALRDLEGQGSLRIVARPSRPYMSKIDSTHHLNLTNSEQVVDAIRSIYAEHFSSDAIGERIEKDLPILHLKLPIILQVFVKPDVTGIIMPYREEAGFFYITAWKGFGFDLDFHRADHYLVNYRDLMLEKFLNNTSGDVFFFDQESGSITRTQVLNEEASEPFLDHDEIIEMCKLYSENASELGGLAIEFKTHGSDVSFISLKDAKLLEAAESALEDLRSAPKAEARAPEPAAPESAQEPSGSVEPAEHAPEAQEPSEPTPSSNESSSEPVPEPSSEEPPEPTAAEQPTPRPDAPEVVAEPALTPEVSHSSDAAALVSRLVDKYVAINPELERQFRLLEQDLLDALR